MANTEYQISVRDLMHKPGQMREYKLDIVTPEDMGEGIAKVSKGVELDLDVRLESVHEGILATGEVFVDADAECSRCLDPLTVPIEVDFQELFAYSLTNEDDSVVEDEQIDLDQVIRDAVVLNLPFHPLCSEDCPGLCAECGVKMADNPHHVHEAPIDSRWNALESFTKKEE
ncbi:YceD family protein [Rhodoluna sp.]|uniref:YceD family protein n=1 Tax=Rhodoluna sp. TaxID=1969481 RepID=UPI0025E10E0D|nr:YceD family protein [Rhodoluna sp.]